MFFWLCPKGRLNRQRYFLGSLLLGGAGYIVSQIMWMLAIPMELWVIFFPFFLYASIILTIKRLHDMDYSGFVVLLCFVPLVSIIIDMMLLFGKGDAGPNKYGDDPLQAS